MTRSPLETMRDTMTDNLIRLYRASSHDIITQGRQWYPDARVLVADLVNANPTYNANTVACVIAAVSPQCDWHNNVRIASSLITGEATSFAGGALPTNIRKARAILANYPHVDDVAEMMRAFFPCGPKVNAFARNLAGDDTIATVDSHAYQAARNDATLLQTLDNTRYRIVAECYANAAHEVDETVTDFQAAIWLAWKDKYPRIAKRLLRRS